MCSLPIFFESHRGFIIIGYILDLIHNNYYTNSLLNFKFIANLVCEKLSLFFLSFFGASIIVICSLYKQNFHSANLATTLTVLLFEIISKKKLITHAFIIAFHLICFSAHCVSYNIKLITLHYFPF